MHTTVQQHPPLFTSLLASVFVSVVLGCGLEKCILHPVFMNSTVTCPPLTPLVSSQPLLDYLPGPSGHFLLFWV